MTLHDGRSLVRAAGRVLGVLCLLLAALPRPARAASLLADRLELTMYGRMGVAWTPTSGRFIQGKTLNLTGTPIGGRLEEGDYLEPTIRLHLLEPNPDPAAPSVDLVLTPSMFSSGGLFAGVFSDRFTDSLSIQLFQAYVEARNVGLANLKVWGGARLYRGTDVHIADLYYFNNLSGQGGGVGLGKWEAAIILQTSATSPQYNFDADGDGTLDLRRERTVFVAQYNREAKEGHLLQGLAELHLLPAARVKREDGTEVGFNADWGWALGIKGRLDLGNGGFNELSVRYGSRAASGSRAGSQTWDAFGAANVLGRYDDAAGLQVVDHVLYNFNSRFSLNGYGILHYNRGLDDTGEDDASLDFALGARGTVYVVDYFHLLGEATYQGLRPRGRELATAVKLSLIPTYVPVKDRTVWARPHFRVFYTIAFYDRAAVDNLYSPYLQTVGPTRVGHYLGARVEWFF